MILDRIIPTQVTALCELLGRPNQRKPGQQQQGKHDMATTYPLHPSVEP